MRKKKLTNTVISTRINQVIVGGKITSKTKLLKAHKDLPCIKFVLDNEVFCITYDKNALAVNQMKKNSLVVVEGKLALIKHPNSDKPPTNVVLCREIELYTEQPKRRKKT